MADDKKPMNRLDFGESEIERIGKSFERMPLTERRMQDAYSRASIQMNALSRIPNDVIAGSRSLSRILTTAPNTMQRAEDSLSRSLESRIERSNLQAMNTMERRFSPSSISGMVSSMSRDPSMNMSGIGMAGMPYSDLSTERDKIQRQLQILGRQSADAAGRLFSERGMDQSQMMRIDLKSGAASRLVGQLASVESAMKLQESQGLDPKSRTSRLFGAVNDAQNQMSAESIAREIRDSGGISIKGRDDTIKRGDIGNAIVSESKILIEAFKGLEAAVKRGEKDLSSYNQKIEDAADNIDKLKKAQGSSDERRGSTLGYLNAAGGAFNAIGGAAQQILVGQRMQQIQNASGFANLANTQYDMYTKARGGDIASQLALSQFGGADVFGSEMRQGTKISQGAYLVSGAAQTAAGGIQMSEGFKNAPTLGYMNSGVGNNLAQGGQNVAQGLATTAVTGMDMLRGTSAEAARLAGIQANMQARMAIQQVGARQSQGLRNFYTGLDVVGQDMGGRSSGFIQDAISGQNLQRMIGARLSPEQFTQMSQFGAANMGSTFDVNQVFGARNLESRGFGSMQTNMQRMATLAGAGANNPQEGMESILSVAVAKGLDSSKSINAMVDNTASITSQSLGAALGIDTTSATSSLLANAMNPMLGNKEFAISRAMTAQQLANAAMTDTSVSFTGMSNTAGLQRALGIGGIEALGLQSVDLATLKSLKTPKDAAAFFRDQGVNISESQSSKALDIITKEKQTQLLRPAITSEGLNAGDIADKMRQGTLTEAERAAVARGARRQGYSGFTEFNQVFNGVSAPNVSGAVGKDLAEGKGPTDLKKQMDELRTSGFKQLSEAATTASDDLKKFGGALKVFTDLQNKFEKDGDKNEREFSTAAGKMAADFSAVVGDFGKATTQYEKASAAMFKAAGLISNGMSLVPESLTNTLNQIKGSSRGN